MTLTKGELSVANVVCDLRERAYLSAQALRIKRWHTDTRIDHLRLLISTRSNV